MLQLSPAPSKKRSMSRRTKPTRTSLNASRVALLMNSGPISTPRMYYHKASEHSPETSFGSSVFRWAARKSDSVLVDSILSRIGPAIMENQSNTPVSVGGITTSVLLTTSGRTAGYAAPSARCDSHSMLSEAVAARYTNSLDRGCKGRSTANPVLPVRLSFPISEKEPLPGRTVPTTVSPERLALEIWPVVLIVPIRSEGSLGSGPVVGGAGHLLLCWPQPNSVPLPAGDGAHSSPTTR